MNMKNLPYKKIILIGLGLTVIGGLIYYFGFKNKSEKTDTTTGTPTTKKTTTGTPTTGTPPPVYTNNVSLYDATATKILEMVNKSGFGYNITDIERMNIRKIALEYTKKDKAWKDSIIAKAQSNNINLETQMFKDILWLSNNSHNLQLESVLYGKG